MKEARGRKDVYAASAVILIVAVLAISLLSNLERPPITGHLTAVQQTITQEQAFDAILSAQQDMRDMQAQELGVLWVNDTLFEAKKAFGADNYSALYAKAQKINDTRTLAFALRLLIDADSEKVESNYTKVLEKTNAIVDRKKRGLLIKDSIHIAQSTINDTNQTLNVAEVLTILTEAEEEFENERYDSAERLLNAIEEKLSDIKAEATLVRTIYTAGRDTTANFVRENIRTILVLVAAGIFIALLSFNRVKLKMLKKRMTNMRLEKEVLAELIKMTQAEYYYGKQKMSRQTFDVRISNYKERIRQINGKIPVIAARIKKISRGKRVI